MNVKPIITLARKSVKAYGALVAAVVTLVGKTANLEAFEKKAQEVRDACREELGLEGAADKWNKDDRSTYNGITKTLSDIRKARCPAPDKTSAQKRKANLKRATDSLNALTKAQLKVILGLIESKLND